MARRITLTLFAAFLTVSVAASEIEPALRALDETLVHWAAGDDAPRRNFAIQALSAVASPRFDEVAAAFAGRRNDPASRLALGKACVLARKPDGPCKAVSLELLASHHPLDNDLAVELLLDRTFPLARRELLGVLPPDSPRAASVYAGLCSYVGVPPLPLRDKDVGRIARTLGGNWTVDGLDRLRPPPDHDALIEKWVDELVAMESADLERLILEGDPSSWPSGLSRVPIEVAAIRRVPMTGALRDRLEELPAIDRIVAGVVFDDPALLESGLRGTGLDTIREAGLERLKPFIASMSEESSRLLFAHLDQQSPERYGATGFPGLFARGDDFENLLQSLISDRRRYGELRTIVSSPDPRAVTVRALLRTENAFPTPVREIDLTFDDDPEPGQIHSSGGSFSDLQLTGFARTLALLSGDHLPWTSLMYELDDALPDSARRSLDAATGHEIVVAILARHGLTEASSIGTSLEGVTFSVHPEIGGFVHGDWRSGGADLPARSRQQLSSLLLSEMTCPRVAPRPLTDGEMSILEQWLASEAEEKVDSLFENVKFTDSLISCGVGYFEAEAGVRWPEPTTQGLSERHRTLLVRRLTADDAETRYRAAHLLWEYFRDPRGPELLERAHQASDGQDRERALRHLTTMRWRPAANLYLAALGSDRVETRVAALGGIRELQLREALTDVENALADPDSRVREMACTAFVRMPRPGTWQMLLPLIDSSSCAGWQIDPGADLLPYLRSKNGAFDRHDRKLILRFLDYELQESLGKDATTEALLVALEQQSSTNLTAAEALTETVNRSIEDKRYHPDILDDLAGVALEYRPESIPEWWEMERKKSDAELYRSAVERHMIYEGRTEIPDQLVWSLPESERTSAARDLLRAWDLRDSRGLHDFLLRFTADDSGNPAVLIEPERRQSVEAWIVRLGGPAR